MSLRERGTPLGAPMRAERGSDPTDLAIAARGLCKRYGKRCAVDGLDLSVPAGVVYGFLGPNGAGKTTTMRMLAGLIRPDAGEVHLLGRPFCKGDRTLLGDVGALVESPSFYPYLSARENLRAFAATGRPPATGRVDEVLDLVGLLDRASDRVQDYSLGMKQRLGIGAALLSDPRLLLLDEPSNGLDPGGIVDVRETLRSLASVGKTVFVSSHILGEVRLMVNIVGIISAGRMVREGPIDELLAAESRMRVRVAPNQTSAAIQALAALPGAADTAALAGEPGWLTVAALPEQGSLISRLLAQAGLFPMALEPAGELEHLFLHVTDRAEAPDPQQALESPESGEARVEGAA